MEEKKQGKNKGGRPKKEQARTHKMGFNATPLEYERIKGKAEQAGLKVADYLRDIALKGKARKVPTAEEIQHFKVLAGAANNLNQLAKQANLQDMAGVVGSSLFKTLNLINKTLNDLDNQNKHR